MGVAFPKPQHHQLRLSTSEMTISDGLLIVDQILDYNSESRRLGCCSVLLAWLLDGHLLLQLLPVQVFQSHPEEAGFTTSLSEC